MRTFIKIIGAITLVAILFVAGLWVWQPIALEMQLAAKNVNSPSLDAKKDLEKGVIHCFSVSGISSFFPGVTRANDMNFCSNHESHFVGTSDVILGGWHDSAMKAAYVYATEYNQYVVLNAKRE